MIDPLIGSALISGGASLLGGLFGGHSKAKAQREANETNLRIARETNAQNYRIFQEQQAFNENQFNRWLDYSTPSAQRERFEDAGINPYMAVGQLSSGTPSSALTSANAAPMQAAQVQPVTQMGDALQMSVERAAGVFSSLIQSVSQSDLNSANAEGVKTDNKSRGRKNEAEIGKTESEARKNDSEWRGQEFTNSLNEVTKYNQIKLSDMAVDIASKQKELLDQQVYQTQLQNAMSGIDLGLKSKYADLMFKAELSKLLAETFAIGENVKQGWANVSIGRENAATSRMNAQTNAAVGAAQIKELVARAAQTVQQTAGIRIDNDVMKRSADFLVGINRSEYYSSIFDSGIASQEYIRSVRDQKHYNANNWTRWISGFVPFAGGVAAGLGARVGNKRPVRVRGFGR